MQNWNMYEQKSHIKVKVFGNVLHALCNELRIVACMCILFFMQKWFFVYTMILNVYSHPAYYWV